MQKYISAVACAAVICGLCDVLIPKSWQKYIGILTGALLLAALISPLQGLGVSGTLQLSFDDAGIKSYDLSSEVEKTLENNICADIESRILTEFSVNTSADVEISACDGKITGVDKISLSCAENEQIRARLYEVYAANNIIFKGAHQ